MNVDELRAVQDREREKDSLQHLRDSFYEEVGSYIADLRAERERRAADVEDPFADPEVRRLTDEIQTAEEVAESIYERRMGKLVKTASLAAAGYAAETEGLTEEEADLFEDLVARIEENQETVLDVLSGGGDGGTFVGSDDAGGGDGGDTTDLTGADPSDLGPDAGGASESEAVAPDGATGDEEVAGTDVTDDATGATSSGPDGAPPETPPDRPPADAVATDDDGSETDGEFSATAAMGDPDRVTVRITADVGEIVGIDGTAYDLAPDDVVTLPEENAMPLVEKEAAEQLE